METQRHEKPSISIGGLFLRGVVKYDPCGVQLGGVYGEGVCMVRVCVCV